MEPIEFKHQNVVFAKNHPNDEKTILNKIKKFFVDWKYIPQNDAVKKCELYKNVGCSHVDGFLCNFPNCSLNYDYIKEKSLSHHKP